MASYDGFERATVETIETVLRHYIVAALWSSTGEDGEPLDATFGPEDLAPETVDAMREDVTGFLAACWGDTWEGFAIDLSGIEPEQVGHDFWLTRNSHGAGFWDRGLGEVGDELTTLAKSFGEVELYAGDDGRIYQS